MKQKEKKNPITNNPRKAVWIRIAAHSCLINLKSLGRARTTVAIAAPKASSESDDSDAAKWLLFDEDPYPSDELLHSLHFFLVLSFTFSCKINIQPKNKNEKHGKQFKKKKSKQKTEFFILNFFVVTYVVCDLGLFTVSHKWFQPFSWDAHFKIIYSKLFSGNEI